MCACVEGAIWSKFSLKCSCNNAANYVITSSSTCGLCSSIANTNGISGSSCTCNSGYTWTVVNLVGSCVCNVAGYYINPSFGCVTCLDTRVGGTGAYTSGVCPCPADSAYDADLGSCVCNDANMAVYEVSGVNKCMCNGSAGYVWNKGNCVLCTSPLINGSASITSENTYYTCTCDPGSAWFVSNQGINQKSYCKCGVESAWGLVDNLNTCICLKAYFAYLGNLCLNCADERIRGHGGGKSGGNYIASSNSCTCPSLFIWDATLTQCVCV